MKGFWTDFRRGLWVSYGRNWVFWIWVFIVFAWLAIPLLSPWWMAALGISFFSGLVVSVCMVFVRRVAALGGEEEAAKRHSGEDR